MQSDFYAVTVLTALLALSGPATAAPRPYKYVTIAATGGLDSNAEAYTSILGGPSVNQDGKVAFAGTTAGGDGVYVGDGSSAADNFAFFYPARLWSAGVQINDEGQVVARGRTSLGFSDIVRFSSLLGDPSDQLATGLINDTQLGQFGSVFAFPSMNNHGEAAFGATEYSSLFIPECDNNGDGVFIGMCLVTGEFDVLIPIGAGNGFNFRDVPQPASNLLRPQVSDTGFVVFREGPIPPLTAPGKIVLLNYDLDATTAIELSSAITGLQEVGQAPGITDGGEAVAFAAQANGVISVYLSIQRGADPGDRDVIKVAGIAPDLDHAELGFDEDRPDLGPLPLWLSGVALNSRVAVIRQTDLGTDRTYVVAFLASPNAAGPIETFVPGHEFGASQALWTVRVDVAGAGGTLSERIHRPLPVVQIDDTITFASPPLAGGAPTSNTSSVNFIDVNDPLSTVEADRALPSLSMPLSDRAQRTIQLNSHQLAFRVGLADGTQAIIRADYLGACMAPVVRYSQSRPTGSEIESNAGWGCKKLDEYRELLVPLPPGADPDNYFDATAKCPKDTPPEEVGKIGGGRIGSRGCVLTTLAMQYRFLVENFAKPPVNPSFLPPVLNPGEFNDLLLALPSQTDQPVFVQNADLSTTGAALALSNLVLEGFFPTARVKWDRSLWGVDPTLSEGNLPGIYERLCEGVYAQAFEPFEAPSPVEVRVRGSSGDLGHSVLATGIANGEIWIADPATSCANRCSSTATPGPDGRPRARRLTDYIGAKAIRGNFVDPDDRSYLLFTTSDNIEFIVVDSQARETGFVAGREVSELPRSTSELTRNDDPENAPPLPTDFVYRTVLIEPAPQTQVYRVVVRGISDTPFEVRAGSALPSGDDGSFNRPFSGVAVADSPTTFVVSFDPEGASTVSLEATPMPNVVGLAEGEAEAMIALAGLAVGTVSTVPDANVPQGSVISQEPLAGEIRLAGTEVNIVVSSGSTGTTTTTTTSSTTTTTSSTTTTTTSSTTTTTSSTTTTTTSSTTTTTSSTTTTTTSSTTTTTSSTTTTTTSSTTTTTTTSSTTTTTSSTTTTTTSSTTTTTSSTTTTTTTTSSTSTTTANQCVKSRDHGKCLVCIQKGSRKKTLSVKRDKLSFFLRRGAVLGRCPRHDGDDDDDDDRDKRNDDDDDWHGGKPPRKTSPRT